MIDDNTNHEKRRLALRPPRCEINALSVEELFFHYKDVNFIYPEKEKRIEPHINLIQENWKKALKSDQNILWVVTVKEPILKRMGSVALWRSTLNGWVSQHLTSTGYAPGVASMMLNVQLQAIKGNYHSGQNWYSQNNKYAHKIFGTIEASIGKEYAGVNSFSYLAVKPNQLSDNSHGLRVVPCNEKDTRGIYEFVKNIRGAVYADSEELDGSDIELHGVNELYQKANLCRRRYIWVAFSPGKSSPVGAAIAYRGPLGFNLSFIENRCDLIVDPGLNREDKTLVCNVLMRKVAHVYFESDLSLNYPLDYIPVVTDNDCADILIKSGSVLIRKYNQSVWLQKGFEKWVKHIEKTYRRVADRIKKHEFERSGCRVNSISISNLFQHYKDSGFIYPEKEQRIHPHIPLIKKNWNKGLNAGEEILWNVTYSDPLSPRMSSLSVWRTTKNSWVAQHLTSNYPTGASNAMLSAQIRIISERYKYKAFQNWFSPGNKFATLFFGTIVQKLGKHLSAVNQFRYLEVRPGAMERSNQIGVFRCKNKNSRGIYKFAEKVNGPIYAQAEELDVEDIELEHVDAIYQKVGLRRKRYLYLAFCPDISKEPLGAAIAYRGPFGFNFSFIENRCDLLVDKNLDNDIAKAVCSALMYRASEAYFKADLDMVYPLDYIPVMTDERCAGIMKNSGAQFIRRYNQSIWLKGSYSKWHTHVNQLYDKRTNVLSGGGMISKRWHKL